MAGTRKARVTMAEQIRLINECRQSGMTDADWCRETTLQQALFTTGLAAAGKRQRIRSQQRITVILRSPATDLPHSLPNQIIQILNMTQYAHSSA